MAAGLTWRAQRWFAEAGRVRPWPGAGVGPVLVAGGAVALGPAARKSLRQIARGLGGPVSTVSREVAQKTFGQGLYRHGGAIPGGGAGQAAEDGSPSRATRSCAAGCRAALAETVVAGADQQAAGGGVADRPEDGGRLDDIISRCTCRAGGRCGGSWRRACGPGGRCAGRRVRRAARPDQGHRRSRAPGGGGEKGSPGLWEGDLLVGARQVQIERW